LARYVVLNPVRAGMTGTPGDWLWSSYRATLGDVSAPPWLEVQPLLARFDPGSAASARAAYANFVSQGVGKPSPWEGVRNQLFLGSEAFAGQFLAQDRREKPVSGEVPRAQRGQQPPSLEEIARQAQGRNGAIRAAWATGAYTQRQIGDHFGLGYSAVSRIVKTARPGARRGPEGSPPDKLTSNQATFKT
ncbi:MAG: addiction module toxin RelE, partial [Alphaproteobacteria bacterium]|nr:addiction module toxin RelE [Alphaproteobacteria bacterium]